MTLEQGRIILNANESRHNEKNKRLRGLSVLSRHIDNLDTEMAAEHDKIWCGNFEETVVKMTEAEVTEMAICGWFEDEETDSWASFV